MDDRAFDSSSPTGAGDGIRAVLFDVGGPLDTEVEFERLMDTDIRVALSAEGVDVSDAQYAAAAAWAVESFAPSTYHAIIHRLVEGDSEAARRVAVRVAAGAERRRNARGGIELRPGVTALLEGLDARGVALGLATNHPGSILVELERAGIARFFTQSAHPEPGGYRKPDVRVFLRECMALGVEPGECIMVGDRVDNDIVPAKLLGMRTVLFRTGRHIAQQPRSWDEVPDAEVRDAVQLKRALDHLIGG